MKYYKTVKEFEVVLIKAIKEKAKQFENVILSEDLQWITISNAPGIRIYMIQGKTILKTAVNEKGFYITNSFKNIKL